MGITQKKVDLAVTHAQQAWAAGLGIFVARFWDEVMAIQTTGGVPGVSNAIHEIEAIGWHLDHVAYAWSDRKSRGLGYFVFRRGGAFSP